MMNSTQERNARRAANNELYELCKGYHTGLALDKLDAILTRHGFNALEPAVYCGRDGRVNEQVGPKTWFSMTWHKMDVTGRYELVAVLS